MNNRNTYLTLTFNNSNKNKPKSLHNEKELEKCVYI